MYVAFLIYQILVVGVSGRIFDWLDTPYKDNTFNTPALFNSHNVSLQCNNSLHNDDALKTVQYWITPDLTIMKPGVEKTSPHLDGEASWSVAPDDGLTMTLDLIQPQHSGFYYCVLEYGGQLVVIKKSVNYRGPHWGDLWVKYGVAAIIATSCTGTFLLLTAVMFIINHIFFTSERTATTEWMDVASSRQRDRALSKHHTTSITSHDNVAMELYNAPTQVTPREDSFDVPAFLTSGKYGKDPSGSTLSGDVPTRLEISAGLDMAPAPAPQSGVKPRPAPRSLLTSEPCPAPPLDTPM